MQVTPFRGRTIRQVTPDKWVVDEWSPEHSGFVSEEAAKRSIERADHVRND